jgi:hypothetical protein
VEDNTKVRAKTADVKTATLGGASGQLGGAKPKLMRRGYGSDHSDHSGSDGGYGSHHSHHGRGGYYPRRRVIYRPVVHHHHPVY